MVPRRLARDGEAFALLIDPDALFRDLPLPAWLCESSSGRIIDVNEEVSARFGYDRDEIVGATITDLCLHTEARPRAATEEYHGVRQMLTKRGEARDVRFLVRELPVAAGGDLRVVVAVDVTLERRVERALRESHRRYEALAQSSSDVVTIIEPDTTIAYASPSLERLVGMDPRAMLGTRLVDVVHSDDVGTFLAGISEVLTGQHATHSPMQSRWRRRDGTWRNVESVRVNLLDDPAIGGIVLTTRDVTERKALEDQLAARALHDSLTGLANRALFRDRVERAVERVRRHGDPVAVILVDIDHFKGINDTFGNAAGDELLTEIGRRIAGVCGPGDTVARLAGDEFGIVTEGRTPADAMVIASQVGRRLSVPLTVNDAEALVTASIAVAIAEKEGTGDQLLRNADVVLYTAKTSGGARVEAFRPSMTAAIERRVEIGTTLHRAIERGELFLMFQPIHDLATGRIAGFEALLRWRHPKRGVVPPDEFISVAEQTGLIVPMGRQALVDAARTVRGWQERFDRPDLVLHVNVSQRQLQDPAFVDDVADAVMITSLHAPNLTLEITESMLMHDVGATVTRLTSLRELGIRIAIDDFGTGYSSLSYLRHLPVDSLKIDKTFVEGIDGTAEDSSLARAIVRLGRTLHLDAVAEGIERRSQLEALRHAGCPYGQGFLLERPLDAVSVEELLAADAGARAGGFAEFFSR